MVQINNLNPKEAITSSPLLSELDTSSLDELISVADIAPLPARHTVFNQGDSGQEMYLVLEGQLEVNIVLPNGDVVMVNHLQAGDTFGEIALFDQRQRTATVKTVTPCKVLIIQRDKFVEFLFYHPEVAIQLLDIFAKQVRTTNDLMKECLSTNIGTRLAKTINNIAHSYGRHTAEGLKIDCRFSNDDLAEISGLPAEIIASHLHDWRSKGLISLRHGYIVIHHPEELDSLESRFV